MQDKILFLDIDGVLNSEQSAYFWRKFVEKEEDTSIYTPNEQVTEENVKIRLSEEFCPIAVSNLHRIVAETGCKIVVSSTWRYGQDLEMMKEWFKYSPLIRDALIGKTPSLVFKHKMNEKDVQDALITVPRGVEIKAWLESHKVNYYNNNQFAIIDDDDDMWPVERNFFSIEGRVGLTVFNAVEVINFLNKKKES